MEYSVRVLKTIEEVENLRYIWEKMQEHPNVDIDFFITIIKSRVDALRPHVILFSRDHQPEAIAVGRIDRKSVGFTLGYKSVCNFSVPCLTILYGGLLGNWSKDICQLLVLELLNSLKRNEAVIASLDFLKADSQVFHIARKEPNFVCRDHVTKANSHWKMTLPTSLDEFLRRVTSKHRYWLRRLPRVLEKDYPNRVKYKYYRGMDELDQLFAEAEEIAARTYQRALGAGFMDNAEMRQRLALSADKGWLRAYLLYVDEKPCAFWIGSLYGKVFYLEFTGYDSALKRYELGTILFMRLIEDLSGSDTKEIDFGFGSAFYKQRFGDQNWTESSVYIYAPTIKGVVLNMIRTANLVPYRYAAGIAEKTGILQKIKRVWRDKLIRNRNDAGDIK